MRFLLASVVAVNHLAGYTPLGWMVVIQCFGPFEAILGFLLISGYSVTVSYQKQPDGFLLRRVKRLYPVYLAAIALTCVVIILEGGAFPGVGTLILNGLFLNQLLTTTSLVVPAWSLSLEFWLYCLAPFLAKMSAPRIRLLIVCSFASFLVFTLLRGPMNWPFNSAVGFGLNLPLLGFIWIAGMRLALFPDQQGATMRDIRLIFGVHIALFIAIRIIHRARHDTLDQFLSQDALGCLLAIVSLVCVIAVFERLVLPHRPSVRRSPLLRFMGDVSYPLYLLHAPIYFFVKKTGLENPLWYFLSAVAGSAVVYQLFDFYSKERHQKIGTD